MPDLEKVEFILSFTKLKKRKKKKMGEKKSPDNDVLQHGYQPKGVVASDGKISNQLPSNPPTGGSSEQKG